MKISEGYPDLTFNLYGRKRKPVAVELTSESPTSNVSFALGPKCGVLTITAIDDATGSPVPSPRITIRNPSEPGTQLSTGQALGSRILIPPDEDITVEVSAEGHKPWHLEEHPELSPTGVVHLHSQDRQEMTVRLKRQRPD